MNKYSDSEFESVALRAPKRHVSWTKTFFMLLACLLLLTIAPVRAQAGTKQTMQKLVTALRQNNTAQIKKYNDMLPETAATEKAVRKMSAAQKAAYKKIVKEHYVMPANTIQMVGLDTQWLWGYFLTDIDNDGSAELITEIGTCEADVCYHFYRYKKGKAVEFADMPAGHSALVGFPGTKYLIYVWAHMGYESISLMHLEKGRFKSETIWSSRKAWDNQISLRNMLYDHIKYDRYYDPHVDLKDLK